MSVTSPQAADLVGAGDAELAVLELDVALGGFEHVGGDLLGLGLDLVERLDDRRHADGARARAVGAHAELHLVGVAVHDRDVVDRNAEPVGDKLGERGLVALTVAVRASENLDRAGRVDPDLGRFPAAEPGTKRASGLAGCDAARLDVGREADAPKLTGACGILLALSELIIIGDLHRLLERNVVIADVVRQDHWRLVREGLDEIDPAQFGWIRSSVPARSLPSDAQVRK